MTNPMIEKKVEEVIKALTYIEREFYQEDNLRARNPHDFLRQALTDMYETGYIGGQNDEENIEKFMQRGAVDMKRRILGALPEEIEIEEGCYINLRETVANAIKSIHSQ